MEMEMDSPIRNQMIHSLAAGIKNNSVSDADILSFGLLSSAAKKNTPSRLTAHSIPAQSSVLSSRKPLSTLTDADILEFAVRNSAMKERPPQGLVSATKSSYTDADLLSFAVVSSARKENKNKNTEAKPVNKVLFQDDDFYNYDNGCADENVVTPNEKENDADVDVDVDVESEACADSDTSVMDTPQKKSKMELKKLLQDRITSALEYQLIGLLNKGTFEELVELHGIGVKRALKIIEHRSTSSFKEPHDLVECGFLNHKQVEAFFRKNVCKLIGLA